MMDLKTRLFISQRLIMLELKKEKATYYVLSWKSKGVYTSKLKSLYIAFSHSIKLSGYRMGIKFDKYLSAVEQNNYLTKTVNVCIICYVNAWPKHPINNFNFKNCLFGETSVVKNSDKEKGMYRGHGITFDGTGC